jgi:hypothetical protein
MISSFGFSGSAADIGHTLEPSSKITAIFNNLGTPPR